MHGVWFLLRRKEVMQETISVFKDPPVQVWELSPSTRRSDTHTQTHTQLWSACACRLSSKTPRSFEGPSGSRGLLCFTNVSVPHWGQHSTSADKCSETPWKVQNGARNRLFLRIQWTKCTLSWTFGFIKSSYTPTPCQPNIKSWINLRFVGVLMLSSARPTQSSGSHCGYQLACFIFILMRGVSHSDDTHHPRQAWVRQQAGLDHHICADYVRKSGLPVHNHLKLVCHHQGF